jgi:hypothetical protein
MAKRNTTLTPAQRDSAIAAVPALMDSIASVDPYMKFMFSYVPLEDAKKVSKPSILAITGETDRQADATQLREWADTFRAAGNKDVTDTVMPGLNHLFVPDPTVIQADTPSSPPHSGLIGPSSGWLPTGSTHGSASRQCLGSRGLSSSPTRVHRRRRSSTLHRAGSSRHCRPGKGPHEIAMTSDGGTAS